MRKPLQFMSNVKEFRDIQTGEVILHNSRRLKVLDKQEFYPIFLDLETSEEESFLTFETSRFFVDENN